jgi:hypothetical protein
MPLRVFRATRFRKLNAHTDRASEREAEGERDGESSSVTGLRCLDCCHKIGQEIASNPGRLDLSDVTGVTCTSLVLEHLFGFETPRCSRPLEAPRRVDDESDWRVLSSPLPLPLPSPDRSIGEIPQRGLIYVTRAHAHRNRARARNLRRRLRVYLSSYSNAVSNASAARLASLSRNEHDVPRRVVPFLYAILSTGREGEASSSSGGA